MISDYINREQVLEKEKYLDDWNIDLSYVDIEELIDYAMKGGI